jgi:hypothetical protein
MAARSYRVDRLEGRLATLIGDDGATADVPRRCLPSGLREGSVISVPVTRGGHDWGGASADEAASRWHEALLGLILEQLRWRTTGGRLAGCVPSGFGGLP